MTSTNIRNCLIRQPSIKLGSRAEKGCQHHEICCFEVKSFQSRWFCYLEVLLSNYESYISLIEICNHDVVAAAIMGIGIRRGFCDSASFGPTFCTQIIWPCMAYIPIQRCYSSAATETV
jgi:hypothetical protein